MIVLGLIDSKPSSAAILKDRQILSAIAEERLCRIRQRVDHFRPPRTATLASVTADESQLGQGLQVLTHRLDVESALLGEFRDGRAPAQLQGLKQDAVTGSHRGGDRGGGHCRLRRWRGDSRAAGGGEELRRGRDEGRMAT